MDPSDRIFVALDTSDLDKALALAEGLTMSRIEDRRSLLGVLDRARRVLDDRGVAEAMDHFTYQAFDLITGDAARTARPGR